jgi:magnesium transporter
VPHEEDSRHAPTLGENDPVIVDCAVYRDGNRIQLPGDARDVDSALEAAQEPDDFVWIGLFRPSEDEMDEVAKKLDLHPLAVEDAVQAHQRPKLERYDGDLLFMVLKTLWYVDRHDDVETGEIAVFVGKKYVVTVRHGEGGELHETRGRLEESTEVLGHGPFAVLWAVCDSVVDNYETVASDLENDVQETELDVFATTRSDQSKRIYHLKREVAEFRRAVMPLREPLLRLAQRQVPGMPDAASAFFRDVADHAIRVHEQVETFDSLLSSAHDAHMARISVQQNDDMRKISAWVAIAAVPTLIAGIYGMNFDHMPELRWQYGYPLALGLMGAVCLTLHRLFKKSGWL